MSQPPLETRVVNSLPFPRPRAALFGGGGPLRALGPEAGQRRLPTPSRGVVSGVRKSGVSPKGGLGRKSPENKGHPWPGGGCGVTARRH